MMTMGDKVKIYGTPEEPSETARDGVYWYTSGGPWKMVVVITQDEDGWHPEVHSPPFVKPVTPCENIADDMPIWAI